MLTNLKLLAPLLEQAHIWSLVLQHEDTQEHRRRFISWIERSPDHVAAYLLVTLAFDIANDIDRSKKGVLGTGNALEQIMSRSIFARLYDRYEPGGISDAEFSTLEHALLRRLNAN